MLLIVGCTQEFIEPTKTSTELPVEVKFSNPNPKTHQVFIDYYVEPATLEINRGDSIAWFNTHDSYSNLIFSNFDIILPGKTSVIKTFLGKGEYYYTVKETNQDGIIRVN